MKKLAFIFIDGLGIGQCDEEKNPLMRSPRLFSKICGFPICSIKETKRFKGGVLVPTDARLGVEGIPQSATGQTTLFTGVNAASFLGTHISAFPTPKLAKLIEEESVMKKLNEKGVKVTSANLYSKKFFEEREKSERFLFPASTLTIKASGVPFRFFRDYGEDRAVFADITNRLMRSRGVDIEEITAKRASENFYNILCEHDFVFFEYFLTDVYGHAKDFEKAMYAMRVLNEFLETLVKLTENDEDVSVLIVSDHGNVEDLSINRHTMNKVPTILLSKDARAIDLLQERVSSLCDITPFILEYFEL